MGFQKSFKALGDPVRREILSLLRREPMAAGDIAAHFDLSGATVSHHLAILRDARACARRPAGQVHLLRAEYVGRG